MGTCKACGQAVPPTYAYYYYYASLDENGVLCVDQLNEGSTTEEDAVALAGYHSTTIYFAVEVSA